MVRDFHRVIGVEARAQLLADYGRLPDAVAACVGGGSNAIGIFHAFLDDAEVRAARLRGRRGRRRDRPARGHHHRRRRRGAARHPLLPAPGRRGPDDRVALDLGRPGLPGRRPRARLPGRRPAAPAYYAGDRRARRWTPSRCCAAPRGSSRPSRAPTPWPARSQLGRELGPDGARAGQPLRARGQGRRHRGRAGSASTWPQPPRAIDERARTTSSPRPGRRVAPP